MTKIVTAPRSLTPRQKLVRDTELKIQRIYALGDAITFRQRVTIIKGLLDRMLTVRKNSIISEFADQAKARVLSDNTIVVTLTKPVLEVTGIKEGDRLGFWWHAERGLTIEKLDNDPAP